MEKSTKNYLVEPQKQSCYEYMLECYKKIHADAGEYTAFVNIDHETSMSEMISDIENLASFLTRQGYKKDDVLSVFLPTSAHAFVVFYALNKLGIIADFIHPLTPSAQLKEITDFTKSKGIFILDKFAAIHKDVIKDKFTVICRTSDYTSGDTQKKVMAGEEKAENLPAGKNIHFFADIMKDRRESVPTLTLSGDKTAVYMHGSGTTGKSKTVCLPSRAFNYVAYDNYQIDFGHDYGNSYNLCVLPCFHAFGLAAGMHYSMCNAYSSIVMPKFDAVKANNYIAKYPVQHIDGAPSMFRKLYEAPNFINDGLRHLAGLYSGGDIVSESFLIDFAKTVNDHGGHSTLYRGWGLTEMCAVCSTNTVYDYKPNSIGKPAACLDCQILDENKKPLPRGTQGEIALSGPTMMNGYLPDEDIDGDGIWRDENGKKWILTGDIGILDEDGFLFYIGRKKRIIIISGYNVYPYTLEQKLGALPFINELCAVQGYDGDKPLVKLCITLKEGVELSEEEIKKQITDFCEKNVDRFSVPRKIVIMDSLPRTKMEKLDFLKMSDPVPFDPQK